MDRPGKLRLDLYDCCGDPLNEPVDIRLTNQTLNEPLVVRGVMASKPVLIQNLLAGANGLYRVLIDPPSYLPVSFFVNVSPSKVTERPIPFAVDAAKVIKVKFPEYGKIDYAHHMLGDTIYQGLDDIRRAGLLNILSKTRRTPLTGGGVVLDHVHEVHEVRGDRCFARVNRKLREDIRNSTLEGLFREVPGSLHSHDGFDLAGSFKTADMYGNLQVTLFTKGEETVADIDIDDAAGLQHVFQVVRNAITGAPTHPYNIRDILLRHQEIDPGYRFVLHEDRPKKKAKGQKA